MNRMLYHLVVMVLRLLGKLPRRMRDRCAVALGSACYRLDKRHRRIALRNLAIAFGKTKSAAEIQSLARLAFENLCRMVFEIGWSLNHDKPSLTRQFTVSDAHHYETAMAKGKGVLLLGAHFSNWEFLPVVTYMTGVPIHIVYRPLDAPFMDQLMIDLRTRFGARMIPTSGAMKKIFKVLRKGECVGLLMDQAADWYDGAYVDFFNRRAATNTGLAALAIKSGTPVVPLFLRRNGNGFHAEFGPELPTVTTGDFRTDMEANTQQYNDVIEAYARMHPEQWFWMHNRWKNLPYCPWPRPEGRSCNQFDLGIP